MLSRGRRGLREMWVRGRFRHNGRRSCRCGGMRRGCKRVGKCGGKKGRTEKGVIDGEVPAELGVCLKVRNGAGANDFGHDLGRGGAGPIVLELVYKLVHELVLEFFLLYNGLG